VSELTPGGVRHWATATAAPCTGIFKPVTVAEPLALGPAPGDRFDPATLWWRHERLHRAALRDPERLVPLFAKERDELEARWLGAGPAPAPADAFAEAERRLADWTARLAAAGPAADLRPGFVRRYWAKRDERAGLPA
jgi:hypothetical protein